MAKKAIITISLVSEAEMTDNKEIEKQIKEESYIPFCAEIEESSAWVKKTKKEGAF